MKIVLSKFQKISLLSLMLLAVYAFNYSYTYSNITLEPSGNITTFFDIRDSTNYKVININRQSWFVNDLKYGHVDTTDIVKEAKVQGYFYSKKEAKRSCPDGWRLPSILDWKNMLIHLEKVNESGNNKFRINYKKNKLEYSTKGLSFFDNYNPLELKKDGRINLGELRQFGLVDYWIEDFKNEQTHAHISSHHLPIHNHKKEIIKDGKALRLFKVKCICDI